MRYPSLTIVFLFLFSSLHGFAQENELIGQKSAAYRNLMNYIPKNLRNTSEFINSDLVKLPFNSIQTMWTQNDLVHTDFERKLMNETIEQMAKELFSDGKKVLLRSAGGYLGCPDKSVDTIYIHATKVLDLQLCASCHDIFKDRQLIEVFNAKMYELMKIDPPTERTKLFYGEYRGTDKNNQGIKLIIKEDRSFQFWKYPSLGSGSDYTEGFWKHRNYTLILNSRTLSSSDSISFALQSGRWVEFEDLQWTLKRTKLKTLGNKNWKLKKVDP